MCLHSLQQCLTMTAVSVLFPLKGIKIEIEVEVEKQQIMNGVWKFPLKYRKLILINTDSADCKLNFHLIDCNKMIQRINFSHLSPFISFTERHQEGFAPMLFIRISEGTKITE